MVPYTSTACGRACVAALFRCGVDVQGKGRDDHGEERRIFLVVLHILLSFLLFYSYLLVVEGLGALSFGMEVCLWTSQYRPQIFCVRVFTHITCKTHSRPRRLGS
jgi:hypothetical protein